MVFMTKRQANRVYDTGSIQPAPQEIGVRVPAHLKEDRFRAGFAHGLQGGQLNKVAYMKLSFREGYRTAKLYLREVQRRQGILEFPMRGKIQIRAI